MTGEITLRGKVLPVGGIKEKVLAAQRTGIDTVILPDRNEGDIEDVPEDLRQRMHFLFVENAEEALRHALMPPSAEAATAAAASSNVLAAKAPAKTTGPDAPGREETGISNETDASDDFEAPPRRSTGHAARRDGEG